MIREDFQAIWIGYVTKKFDMWLPEEATEEMFLDIIQKRLNEHNEEIRKVLVNHG